MTPDAAAVGADWDFFIAHAGPDTRVAETLFGHLVERSRPFLDSKCLRLGDEWDAALVQAQRRASVTVVLVSASTPQAYYQREEIAAAIAMAREGSASRHRVIPVYLPGTSATDEWVPYGLRLRHGVELSSEAELQPLAERLLDPGRASGPSGAAASTSLSEDESELVRELFKYKGRCKIGAAQGEHECLWMPSFLCDMQWGWERLPDHAKEAGKTIGSRTERLRWIFVVRDLVARGVLKELPKENRQQSTFYELTDLGWRAGLALSATRKQAPA